MGTLHENQYTFLIIRRSFLHRMRNVSNVVEKNKPIFHVKNKKKYA